MIRLLLISCFAVQSVHADPAPDYSAGFLLRATLRPETVVLDGTRIILGYGVDGAITADGLENAVAHERAIRRAANAELLLRADLNGDGAVSVTELEVHANTVSAGARARVRLGFDRADSDDDGHVSAAEIAAFARDLALERFGAQQAQQIRELILCDLDHDGRLTVQELTQAVSDLARVSAPKKADGKAL
ncbi:MAG TPA: EF-hand domain-containing protein [Paenirhodobacter sp.]